MNKQQKSFQFSKCPSCFFHSLLKMEMFSYEWQTCPIRNLGSKNHNPRLVTSNPRLMTSNPRLVKSNPRLRRQSHPRPKLLLGSWGFGPFLAALAVRCAQGASASTSSEEFRPRVGLPPQARVGFHQPQVGSHQPRVGIHQPRVMIFRTSVSYRAGLLQSIFSMHEEFSFLLL